MIAFVLCCVQALNRTLYNHENLSKIFPKKENLLKNLSTKLSHVITTLSIIFRFSSLIVAIAMDLSSPSTNLPDLFIPLQSKSRKAIDKSNPSRRSGGFSTKNNKFNAFRILFKNCDNDCGSGGLCVVDTLAFCNCFVIWGSRSDQSVGDKPLKAASTKKSKFYVWSITTLCSISINYHLSSRRKFVHLVDYRFHHC